MISNCDPFFNEVKERVYLANIELNRSGLVPLTFGNVSERFAFEDSYLIAIKPSGISYSRLRPDDIVMVERSGDALAGSLRPSSDTPTHLMLYERLSQWSGIAHTHSVFATAWAQSGKSIPMLGTTHADYFNKNIPCTPQMPSILIDDEYEKNTGAHIAECLLRVDAAASPMVLVHGHGPFTFGKHALAAVEASIALEEISKIAMYTLMLNEDCSPLQQVLVDRHYYRKNGKKKYYGQD